MACPVLLSDVRALAEDAAPGVFSPPSRVVTWVATFSSMLSLMSSFGLTDRGAAYLSGWLSTAVETGVIVMGAYRNGDHLLLRPWQPRGCSHLPARSSAGVPAVAGVFAHACGACHCPILRDEQGLLLQTQVSGSLSVFEDLNTMGFSYVSCLFSAFLAQVEQEIASVQMQSAMLAGDASGLIFHSEGISRSSADPPESVALEYGGCSLCSTNGVWASSLILSLLHLNLHYIIVPRP